MKEEAVATNNNEQEEKVGNNNNNNNQNNKRHYNKRKYSKVNPKANVNIETKLIKSVEQNEKIQKNRLNAHYKLNLNTSSKIRITPLGGLGEIGGNMTIFETEESAIIVDIGLSFPNDDMHGVDILIPDFSYVRKIKDKIKAVIITHAHEDHIGAVPFFYKEFQFPLYGTPLALGMISAKLEERQMPGYKSYLHPVEKRKTINIGGFGIEWIHITHSIVDSSALAITTEAGTIIHSGDFKIDHTPIDGYPTDLHRLSYYGEKGVLLLLSDSTNSYNEGFTKSEKTVGPALRKIFDKSNGRIIMSTFSSNVHRIEQALKLAIEFGRKICIIGRSMEKNLNIALDLGYVKIPEDIFIESHEVSKYNDNEVLIVTTGSQGEPMSALFKMAIGEHKLIRIKTSDHIVLSSRAIPGNEASVSTIINYLLKAGAKVHYSDDPNLHVSGHAAQEEQKLMLRLVKPKFFLPVHGEYNHILKHKQTGIDCGVPEKNILLMQDGDVIEVHPKYMKKVKTVKTGKTFVDNQVNKLIDNSVVFDRQKLANDGIVTLIAQVNESDHTLYSKPKVATFGMVNDREVFYFNKELEELLVHFFTGNKRENSVRGIENELKQVVRKHVFRKYRKYPTIVPTVFIM
jgi:ribonuclease J